ncbi:MAG: ABC transporter substrate-binding protein [Candidatus Bathycorpusculaceae bacterium]
MKSTKKAITKIQAALIAVAIIVAGVIGWFAFNPPAPPAPKVGTFAFVGSDVWVFWDPSETFSNEISVLNSVYEGLTRWDSVSKTVKPFLASSWDVSEDALHWTFHLRNNVTFHCGHKFNATAVKYSIDRTINMGKGASYIWSCVDNIEVIDEYTVRFNLNMPAPLDLIACAGYCSHIFCPICTEEHGTDWFYEGHDLGTGPYYVSKYDKSQELVELKKFDAYWRGWTGKEFDTVLMYCIPEPATAKMKLDKGEILIIDHLPFEMVADLKNNPQIVVEINPSWQNMFGLLNTQPPSPLSNKLVRQAISYAVPYDICVSEIRHGYATQSYGVVPPGLLGHSDNLPQYKYNLTKASQLLAEAGYPNGEGLKSLVLTYNAGDEDERRFAEILKAELAKIGVTLDIQALAWTAQMAKAAGPPEERQDIFLFYWWPDYPDPYSWLRSMFHSVPEGQEIVFECAYYNNPQYDALIDEAYRVTGLDKTKAQQLYEQAQRILIDDAVALFIYDWTYVRARRVELKGYVDNPAYPNAYMLYDMYVEKS